MARSRSASKGRKGKKKAPPPPPPILIRIHNVEEFQKEVTEFQGSVLLSVVTPICQTCVNQVIPYLEHLNDDRPPVLKDTNLVVLYLTADTQELAQQLEVMTVPFFQSYSYGNLISQFSGDNLEKALVVAKMAGQAAAEEAARLAEQAKLLAAGGEVAAADPPQ